MVHNGRSTVGTTRHSPDLKITAHVRNGTVLVIQVRGAVDADTNRTFDHYLWTRVPDDMPHVVVDTRDVTLFGAGGVRTLLEHTRRLARQGRQLLIVLSNPVVGRVLDAAQAAAKLRVYDSMLLALAACSGPEEQRAETGTATATVPDQRSDELAELQQEVLGLRTALRTKPVVAEALGVLRERYRLNSSTSAFGLLRDSAQHHNLRVYTLARAVLNTAPPQGPVWFRGRARRPAPSLSFVEQRHDRRGNRSAILSALMDAASYYVRADAAALYLVEQPGDALCMELSANLRPDVVDQVVRAHETGAPRDPATRVIVPDITDEPGLPAQQVLLRAGIRATHSTPLLTGDNQCVGMLALYHTESGFTPSRMQCARLDHAATEVATWLDWHARTVILDALEHVHTGATSGG